jgi:hypothetical protein
MEGADSQNLGSFLNKLPAICNICQYSKPALFITYYIRIYYQAWSKKKKEIKKSKEVSKTKVLNYHGCILQLS